MNYRTKSLIGLIAGIIFSNSLFSQDTYWQQHVDYKINVKLNDVAHEIDADLVLTYTNNSPDKLSEIFFHLWPNAYRDRSTALTQQLLEDGNSSLYFADAADRGYIDLLDFKIDGLSVEHVLDEKHIDIAKLTLPQLLEPGNSIVITTPFRVKIPSSSFSRLGHKDQSYQITQWYPKPAVYDHKGWHPMPYLSQGEFYSEFGKFEVNITVPKNYIVAATGNLQNEEELNWLDNLSKKKINYNLTELISEPSSSQTKTITYTQDNVHDFAWFASKDFNVRKDEFTLTGTGRTITAWAFFPDSESSIWVNAPGYIKKAVNHYSKQVGDYPYDVVSAVHAPLSAGAGMEYPTLTVIGNSGMASVLETVVVHEVGHNWFYGILGSNERLHPWMDEGVNTYYESSYFLERDLDAKDKHNYNILSTIPVLSNLFDIDRLNYIQFYKYVYTINSSADLSQAANLSAEKYGSLNYGFVVYMKVGALFYELRNYLNEEVFNTCMQAYFEEYKFKHPYPEDMQKIFEQKSGKDLNWFFGDVLNQNLDADYKIKSLKKDGNQTYLKIKNKSGLNVPFSLQQFKNDELVDERFVEGFVGDSTIIVQLLDDADRIMIADKGCIDINEKNNYIHTNGLFKKWNKLNFKFLGYPERSDRSTIFYSPALDYNYYDKLMLGVSLYNSFLQTKKFQYVITPFYAFGSSDLTGRLYADYNIFSKSKHIHSYTLKSEIDYFNYALNKFELEKDILTNEYQKYLRINPGLIVNLREKNIRSAKTSMLILENKNIYRKTYSYSIIDSIYKEVNDWNHLYNLTYSFTNLRALDPFTFQFNSEFSSEHGKLSSAFEQSFTYNKNSGEFRIRLFVGAFLFDDSNTDDYRFRLSSWSGRNDYAFDQSFFGRTETDGLWSQQMSLTDGAFKVPTFIGQTRDWIATVNLSASLPGLNFIGAFADLGTFKDAGKTIANKESILYDAGLWFSLGDLVVVYFPIFKSEDIEKSLDSNNIKFENQIRFVFNVNDLRLINLRKKLLNN